MFFHRGVEAEIFKVDGHEFFMGAGEHTVDLCFGGGEVRALCVGGAGAIYVVSACCPADPFLFHFVWAICSDDPEVCWCFVFWDLVMVHEVDGVGPGDT